MHTSGSCRIDAGASSLNSGDLDTREEGVGMVEATAKAGQEAETTSGHVGAVNFDVLLEHYCKTYPIPTPKGDTPARREAREEHYKVMLDNFQKAEGVIKSQDWCQRTGQGALLTSKPRSNRIRQWFSGDEVRYFAGGNPVETEDDLALALLMDKTDREARRVEDLLRNPMRANALEQLFSVRGTAIEAFEEIAKKRSDGDAVKLIRHLNEALVRSDLAAATSYAEGAIRRRAQLLYLLGMAVGVIGLVAISGTLLWFFGLQTALVSGTEVVPVALILGGLGAVISVLQRMTTGDLPTRVEDGLIACTLLGASRPAIGSVLAFAITVLILGGILPIKVPDDPGTRLFFFAGLSFVAGFSERFAQDMLGSAEASLASGNSTSEVIAVVEETDQEPDDADGTETTTPDLVELPIVETQPASQKGQAANGGRRH